MDGEMEEVVEREVKAGGEKKKEIKAADFDEWALRNIKAKLEAAGGCKQEANDSRSGGETEDEHGEKRAMDS